MDTVRKEKEKIGTPYYEGIVSFRALVNAAKSGFNDRRIVKVLYSKEKIERNPSEYSYVRAKSFELSFEIQVLPGEIIDSLSVGSNHGGIIFTATDRSIGHFDTKKTEKNGFYVYLDGIEDPYNFGYAIRSLYAAGVTAILLPERNWMSAAPIVCRSSAGTSEMIGLYTADENTLMRMKASGMEIVCADIDNSESIYETRLGYPLLLVIGGEKRGISAKIKRLADKTVRLDYGRDFPGALSAASAAAILSFEIMRQNMKEK